MLTMAKVAPWLYAHAALSMEQVRHALITLSFVTKGSAWHYLPWLYCLCFACHGYPD